jgi:hypothetical protein
MSTRLDGTRNCTLEAYGFAKALPVDFLRQLGLETISKPLRSGPAGAPGSLLYGRRSAAQEPNSRRA